MIAGDREERAFQLAFAFRNETGHAFIGIPKMSQHAELMIRKSCTVRVGLNDSGIEPLFLNVDAVGRMIRSAHDQVERGFRPGVLEHEAKQIFVVHAPLIAARARSHLIAAVNIFEALFAAKLTDSLPAQKSPVKKSRSITNLLKNVS